MRPFNTLAAAIITISMAACQTSGKETIDRSLLPDSGKTTTAVTPAATQGMAPNVLPIDPAANSATVNGAPIMNNTIVPAQNMPATQQQIVQQPQATAATAPGMNPPHGQPNHRCDIAVGAPLNSPKGQQPAITQPATGQTPPPTVTMSQPTPVKTVTAPGMNPPHGEPNHRCDIAVGAPLNSPVKKADAPVNVPVQKATDQGARVKDSARS